MLIVAVTVAFAALAVCLLDLALTLAVIRRLREHTELISKLPGGPPFDEPILAAGNRAGPFEAVATTGELVSRDRLSDHTLVAIVAPDCHACTEKLPAFVALAGTFPGGRDRVIAAIAGPEDHAGAYREQLEPIARVVSGSGSEQVRAALAVAAFPSFAVLDAEGAVVGSGVALDQLPIPASTPGS